MQGKGEREQRKSRFRHAGGSTRGTTHGSRGRLPRRNGGDTLQ